MTRPRFYGEDPHVIRQLHLKVFETADEMLNAESELIRLLALCDQRRTFVKIGYNSLTGFCVHALKLTKTQSQRIVTLVRRHSDKKILGDRE